MNILFLTTILLTKNCNGGEVASQCFIDALRSNQHKVTVVGYLRMADSLTDRNRDSIVIDERYTETRKSKAALVGWYLTSLLQRIAYSCAKYYSKTYINLVKELLESGKYQAVVIDHAQLGWLADYIPSNYPVITIAHNVEYLIYKEIFTRSTNPIARFVYNREAALIQTVEDHLLDSAQQVWTLTTSDTEYFSQKVPTSKVRTFAIPPNAEDVGTESNTKAFDIGLLGSWAWTANDEALRWFLTDIYPHLPANVTIHVAGKGADWLTDQYENIHYEGVVPSAQEFLAKSKVVAIPTLSGGGIQIKTLDAIASGSQIVATPIALRGIDSPPSTVTTAQLPEDFARQLMVALSASSDQSIQDAKMWYRERQQQFQQDIHDAIVALDDKKRLSATV